MENLHSKQSLQFVAKSVNKTEIEGKTAFRFTISSEGVDRYGDIVRMRGARLDNFKNNPVVLYNHKSFEYPIGKAYNIVVTDKNLQADVVFHEQTPESKLVKKLVEEGFLKATSIGFMPLDYNEITPSDEEISKLPKGKKYITEYTSWDLLEFSIVNIPANPEAVMENGIYKQLNTVMDTKIEKQELPEFDIEAKDVEIEEKAGRTISKANLEKLRKAYESIGEVIKPYMEDDEEKESRIDEEELKKFKEETEKRVEHVEAALKEFMEKLEEKKRKFTFKK